MKKFLFICTMIFVLIVVSNKNYIKSVESKLNSLIKNENNINYRFKVENKKILINEDEEWETFEIIGMNMNASKPAGFPGENLVSKDEYLRWFKYISEMKVNCLRVMGLMGSSFYEALDEFNKDNDKPLYLLQGIYFDEIALKNGDDINSSALRKKLKDEIENTVNAINGKLGRESIEKLGQKYSVDISKYVIGYTLGVEWTASDIIYTDIMNNRNSYKGEYFYSEDGASSLEVYLTEMANYLVEYEVDNFNQQRLVSFIGSAYKLVSEKEKYDLEKVNSINEGAIAINDDNSNYFDIENITATEKFKTGMFVSYNIYPEEAALYEYSSDIDVFLEELKKYHSIPIVISEFGIPSSRLAAGFADLNYRGYVTEVEQGNKLIELHKAVRESQVAGSFLAEWQDSWYRNSWNTVNSVILDDSPYWMDYQTYSQSFGLMAFEPGEEKKICYPDNSINEWSEKDIISSSDNLSLSIKNDEKYMYFMIKADKKINLKEDTIFIGIDSTPKSGSNKASEFQLNFDNDVDFIIKLNGKKNSEMLVQKYYSWYEFYEDIEKLKLRPNNIGVEKHMDEFVPIKYYVKNKFYIESKNEFVERQAFNTGILVEGNGNPEAEDFNSAVDYFVGEDYIELRIPWSLMNFMSPGDKKIHDDYYENFNIKPLDIDGISIGVTVKANDGSFTYRVKSKKYIWEEWTLPKYHERLKRSYYIYKDYLENTYSD